MGQKAAFSAQIVTETLLRILPGASRREALAGRFPGRRGLRQRVARKQPALAGTIRAHAHELPVPELAAEDDPAPARLPRGRLAVVGLMSG